MNDTKRDIDGLIAALGHQKQCDEEGVLIAVSRQAVDEAMAAQRIRDAILKEARE